MSPECLPAATDRYPVPTSTPPKGSDSFVHLHVHTEYSMLDGAARIGDLFPEAAEMGMPALATTDHGYVFGAYEFWKKAQGTGVKPIIGVEAYVTPGTHRTDKTRVKWGDERSSPATTSPARGAYTHMTLLARDNTGHAQPVPDGQPGLARPGLRQVAPRRPRAARPLRQGPDRHDRVRVGRDPDPAAARAVRRGQAGGVASFQRHLRQGELLLRGHGPRPRRRAPRP